jgi:chromosomal replication initiator protein
VRTKAHNITLSFADDVMEYLATTVEGNVRELEGALNTLLIQFEMRGKPITVADAKVLLRGAGSAAKKAVSVQEVVKTIANFYGIEEASIYEKTRRKEVVRPRQVIMFLPARGLSYLIPHHRREDGRPRPHHCYPLVRKD